MSKAAAALRSYLNIDSYHERFVEVTKALRQVSYESVRVAKNIKTKYNDISLLQSLHLVVICHIINQLIIAC